MASPSCNVKDGAGAYTATTTGNNVTPGNAISIQLASVAGVSAWSISCVYTDELSNAVTVTSALTIDNLNKIATYIAPIAGRAYIFQSKINGGIDANGTVQPALTTTLGIYTLAASGNRVLAANETVEGNPTFGYVATINPALRTVAGGGVVPTGTGVRKVVAGVEAAAATLILDADVSATAALAVAKIAPGANTQVLTTTAGVTVWAAAPGGGTIPTGTGFTHITLGAQDAASKKVDLTAAADVTVPGVATGVVTTDGTVLNQASNVLAGASYISVGATPALSGNIRLPNVGTVSFRSGAADLPLIATTGAAIQIGNQTSIGACETYANAVRLWGTTATDIYNTSGSGFALHITSATFETGQPIVGGNSTPYGVHGKTTVATAPPFALVAADYAMDAIMLSSATVGTVTFPAPGTDAKAYYKTVINPAGGGLKTLSTGAGSSPTLSASTTGRYLFDLAGVHLVGATAAYP